MKVLHVLPTRATSYGGPVRIAESIIDYLQSEGHEARIYPIVGENPRGKWFMHSFKGFKRLKQDVIWADVVHIHGLWTLPATLASIFSRLTGKPYVVILHGMLDRWSLQQSARLKWLYLKIFERKNLLSANGICCNTKEELIEATMYANFANIFIIPNGIDVKKFDDLPGRDEMNKLYPHVKDKVVILFMARIHYKKGLDLLIVACSLLLKETDQFHLVVAGDDEGGHLEDIHKLIDKLNLNSFITFVGEVLDYKKRVLLGGSDIFALTSRQEGDSFAIKEAMASALPLLISRQCHYPEYGEMGFARVVATECEDIASSLRDLINDSTLRQEMGVRSRRYAKQHVDLKVVYRELVEVYDDIIHGRKSSRTWQAP